MDNAVILDPEQFELLLYSIVFGFAMVCFCVGMLAHEGSSK